MRWTLRWLPLTHVFTITISLRIAARGVKSAGNMAMQRILKLPSGKFTQLCICRFSCFLGVGWYEIYCQNARSLFVPFSVYVGWYVSNLKTRARFRLLLTIWLQMSHLFRWVSSTLTKYTDWGLVHFSAFSGKLYDRSLLRRMSNCLGISAGGHCFLNLPYMIIMFDA